MYLRDILWTSNASDGQLHPLRVGWHWTFNLLAPAKIISGSSSMQKWDDGRTARSPAQGTPQRDPLVAVRSKFENTFVSREHRLALRTRSIRNCCRVLMVISHQTSLVNGRKGWCFTWSFGRQTQIGIYRYILLKSLLYRSEVGEINRPTRLRNLIWI